MTGGAILLMLGGPYFCSDAFRARITGTDAVSSASVIVEQPSGEYLVYINLDRHTDQENLALWYDFFEGREITYLFEDISCGTASGDTGGHTCAESFRSRLPENQMQVRTEDPVLLLSKAEHGRFDIIILSKETADAYAADRLAEMDNVGVIAVKGAAET